MTNEDYNITNVILRIFEFSEPQLWDICWFGAI